MRALVTGGAGYFGSLLVERLQAAGDDVTVLDIADAGHLDGVRVVRADIRDRAAVRRAVAGMDVVFHNVAQVPLARDHALFEAVNVGGTGILLDESLRAGVAKVVHTSSSAVFGIPETNPVTRDTVPHPLEAYGRAKLDAEQLCLAAASRGLDVSIVRPRTILGHGRLGIFAILFDWIASGARVPVLGGGRNVYQFVHAEDLADAIRLAAGRPGPSVYNIGAEEFGTMAEALGALCRHADTGARPISLPQRAVALAMQGSAGLRLTPFGPYHWIMYGESMWFDVGPAKSELGWAAQWSNEAMFIDSYEWFLRHRHNLGTGSAHRSPAKQGALKLARYALGGRG
ncbi:MAG: NAD-dependent epimerase/dehydratase family protein [Nocardioides sp.]